MAMRERLGSEKRAKVSSWRSSVLLWLVLERLFGARCEHRSGCRSFPLAQAFYACGRGNRIPFLFLYAPFTGPKHAGGQRVWKTSRRLKAAEEKRKNVDGRSCIPGVERLG